MKKCVTSVCVVLIIAVALVLIPQPAQYAFAATNLSTPKVTTSGSTSKIKVSWKKVSGATKYQVYRATKKNGKYKKQITTKKCSYSQKVKKGNKYYYKVRAITSKKKSKFCKPVEGMTRLTAPKSLKLSDNTAGGITVSWGTVKNAVGYNIYRSTKASEGFKKVNTDILTKTNYKDKSTSLKKGTTYYYKVCAVAKVNGVEKSGRKTTCTYREDALRQAEEWIGVKEGSSKEKEIVSIYNSKTKYAKIGYRDPWCAAFVSAVGIKTGNSSVIPIDCYCPRMIQQFTGNKKKDYTYDKTYSPKGGDLIFFDWNRNKVPDHVGMVYSSDDGTVRTIEGNTTVAGKYKTDGVYVRSFGKTWAKKNVQAYCVPSYANKGKIKCTYPVSEEEPEPTVTDPTEPEVNTSEALDSDPVETEAVDEALEAVSKAMNQEDSPEDMTQRQAVETLVEYLQENESKAAEGVEASTYDAFLLHDACEEMGIASCVVTSIDSDGNTQSYNEVSIDGEIYIVDSAAEGGIIEEYTPEGIN